MWRVDVSIGCVSHSFNPIRPGLFSRSPAQEGGGGGLEAQLPKIKVNINRFKRNFA